MFFVPEQLFLIAKIAFFRPFKIGGNTFIPSFLFNFIFLEAFLMFSVMFFKIIIYLKTNII